VFNTVWNGMGNEHGGCVWLYRVKTRGYFSHCILCIKILVYL